MNRKNKRILEKAIKSSLDNIYKTAYKIAKDWDKNTIPLTTLEVILNKSKPSMNTGSKENDIFNMSYGKLLDRLLGSCKMIAEKMDSKSIPLKELKNGLNIIKKGLFNGLSGIGEAASA